MKKYWILASLLISFARADKPAIDLPPQPPAEQTNQAAQPAPPSEPISTTVQDPTNKHWKEYDNRIVKAHFRMNSTWTMMEVKETSQIGSVSFTLSRLPLITFAVTRDPLQGDFDSYVSSAALTPLYPSGFKMSRVLFAGKKSVRIHGTAQDGRYEESYFSTDGKSLYRVVFSAPKESWKEAEPRFDELKRSFRWLR